MGTEPVQTMQRCPQGTAAAPLSLKEQGAALKQRASASHTGQQAQCSCWTKPATVPAVFVLETIPWQASSCPVTQMTHPSSLQLEEKKV